MLKKMYNPDWNETDITSNKYIENRPSNTITNEEVLNIAANTSKLSGIDNGAEVNVVKSVSVNNGLALDNTTGRLSLAQINLSDVEVFTTIALRNAHNTTVWHRGDVSIVTGTIKKNYIYTGTNQTVAGATTNSDWTTLITPNEGATPSQVSAITANTAKRTYPEVDETKLGTITVQDITDNTAKRTYPQIDETKLGTITVQDITDNTAKRTYPQVDETKLGTITVQNITDNNAKRTYPQVDETKLGTITVQNITDNNAKVSNIQSDIFSNNCCYRSNK